MRYYACPNCEKTTGFGYQRIPQEGLLVKCSQCTHYFTITRESPYGNVVSQRQPAMIPSMT
jgi:DNA-directed RNA polymerase subunit RPC12/RpoP